MQTVQPWARPLLILADGPKGAESIEANRDVFLVGDPTIAPAYPAVRAQLLTARNRLNLVEPVTAQPPTLLFIRFALLRATHSSADSTKYE